MMIAILPHSRTDFHAVRRPAGSGRAAGMTLVELMLVILVIGILFAIMMPAIGRLRQRTHRADARAAAAVIYDAMQQYHFEYGVWPLDYGSNQTEFTADNHKVLAYLDVRNSYIGGRRANPKQILFLTQTQEATPTEFDDFNQDSAGNIIDPWDNPFRITFSPDESTPVRAVEVRSAGPNGEFDYCPHPSRHPRGFAGVDDLYHPGSACGCGG